MSLIKNTGKSLADVIPGLGRLTFDSDIGKVFVTSGTGVIGYRVAASKCCHQRDSPIDKLKKRNLL